MANESDHQSAERGAKAAAYNRLRRLQEYSRTNIPAMMAHRSTSTFTLHNEPSPSLARDRVLVIVYPQDPFVGEPEVRTMSTADIQPGLMNSRVRIQATPSTVASPDADGNYLFWPGQPEFDQVNTFYFTTFTLRMYERYARRALPWAFPSPRITVDPHSGNMANAFYHEQERLLGFHTFTQDETEIATAHSADIIAHETAHAVLDGMRDLYNECFSLGPAAFHESFADITAVLVALHDDSLVRRLLDWTQNDLRTDNFVAQVAEHLTEVLRETGQPRFDAQTVYLRNAFNSFVYQPFDTLAYQPSDPTMTLGRQPHNYSRLFTGAFYDMLVGIFDQLRQDTPAHIAIYRARDIAAFMLVFAIESGPVGEFTFADMARSMISAESILYEQRFQSVLVDVFAARGLLAREDCAAHIQTQAGLPKLRLPETINSALASALFLEDQVIPALNLDSSLDYVPMAAYRNASGYAFLSYFLTDRLTLEGAVYQRYNGSAIDLFGGLTLAFDADDTLRAFSYHPIDEHDRHQVRVMTADLIANNLVVDDTLGPTGALRRAKAQSFRPNEYPLGHAVQGQLLKYPVMYDPYPPLSEADFLTYLRQVQDKKQS